MEDVLDAPATGTDVKYAGFWLRLGAMILDGLILAPISIGLMYFNITTWKSSVILVMINLVGLVYKPFMEVNYGATFGKMAMNLKVVNLQLEAASIREVLLRNIFHITGLLLTFAVAVVMFADPGFEEVSGFMDYTQFTQKFTGLQTINYLVSALTVIDGIVLLTDDKKRSLHDKIGKTFVIETKA